MSSTKTASKFLMVCALAAIGLNTSFASMKKAGIRPMIHGFIISALVVIVALLVEMVWESCKKAARQLSKATVQNKTVALSLD